MKQAKKEIGHREFVFLMALLMSMTALSIDAMLPALGQIGQSLNVQNPNDTQMVISAVFLGMAGGLLLYGPLSDSYGRKNSLYLGIGIFLVGIIISIYSTNFSFMLMGRLLQGFGSASARVVTVALIRDRFEGSEMGRMMSLILAVFIMVPAMAPSIGQGILYVADWRAIFWFIFALGIFGGLWLNIRQPETLTAENRRSFTFSIIYSGIKETLKNPISRTYAIISGIIFGAFIGYLSSAQQIFQLQYELKDSFPLYFGGLALAIGVSSFVNSKLVMRFKMEALCQTAMIIITIVSSFFMIYMFTLEGDPSLTILMMYLLVIFFNVGILFGNLNTLAVQPLGHIAGVGTSIVGSVQTIFSVGLGGLIGQLYNGTVIPLISGFFACGILGLLLFLKLQHHIKKHNLYSPTK